VKVAGPPARPPWNDRPETGTNRSQTGAPLPGSVTAEGGGTSTPTQGGGIGVTRARGNLGAFPR
jgi:hypothetical protein